MQYKKQCEDTQQASEPDLDIKTFFEWTDMINMLRTLIKKKHSIFSWIEGKCKQRSRNSMEVSKGNSRNQKRCNKNKECFWWALNCTWPRKESVNINIGQGKPPKLKCKIKK